MRTPTRKNKEDAARWLSQAQHYLSINEYHRVKVLCRQVTNALRRKENEHGNT